MARRHINTTSDSEVLLNVLAHELDKVTALDLGPEDVFAAVSRVHQQIRGAYAVVAVIIGQGLLAFRDPNGIRPLVLGRRNTGDGRVEHMLASESVALDVLGFETVRDVAPSYNFV